MNIDSQGVEGESPPRSAEESAGRLRVGSRRASEDGKRWKAMKTEPL